MSFPVRCGGGDGAGVSQPSPTVGGGLLGNSPSTGEKQSRAASNSQDQAQNNVFPLGKAPSQKASGFPSVGTLPGPSAEATATGTPALPAAGSDQQGLFAGTGVGSHVMPSAQAQHPQNNGNESYATSSTGLTGAVPASNTFGGVNGSTSGLLPSISSGTTELASLASSAIKHSADSWKERSSVLVDLHLLFAGVLAEPRLFSDEEISEQLDHLLDPGETPTSASQALKRILDCSDYRCRVDCTLQKSPVSTFYAPASEETAQDFARLFEDEKPLPLLHGWIPGITASGLDGKSDLVDGVRSLARCLRLAEARAMQVLFLYLKDQVRRGLIKKIDSREYKSPFLHEKIRHFYFSQRIYFFRNMQEFFRIDLDADYFLPELRQEVHHFLAALTFQENSSSFAQRLQEDLKDLWQAIPPRVQELDQAYSKEIRPGHSAAYWERARQEWVKQNVVEQCEVLVTLLLVLARRESLGFRAWCQLFKLWIALRMGELLPEKAYIAAQDSYTLLRAKRVSSLMTLVAIQGLQLGLLWSDSLGGSVTGEEHPFAADLREMPRSETAEIEELFYAMKDAVRAERFLPAPGLISVILLFFTCFLHLSGPLLRPILSSALQHRLWDRAAELQSYVAQRAAQAHFAELVVTLILDDEAAEKVRLKSDDANIRDQWACSAFHAVLRRKLDNLCPENARLEVEAVQVTLSDAMNAFIAACYSGIPQAPQPLHPESMTAKKLEFLVFLVATIYHDHLPLVYSFWEDSGLTADSEGELGDKTSFTDGEGKMQPVAGSKGLKGHPLKYLASEARERHPLLYFHLIASMACDTTTASWVRMELSQASLCTHVNNDHNLEHCGGCSYRMPPTKYFDADTGASVPPGTCGQLLTSPSGQVSRLMRWDISLWAILIHQIEDFACLLARCRLLPLLATLEKLRSDATAGTAGKDLGLNTVVDHYSSLLVYGPCPGRTESVARELLRRGAWGLVRYMFRRVEMVLDQLSILLSLEERRRRQQVHDLDTCNTDISASFLLDVLTQARGMSPSGVTLLAYRLPTRLIDIVYMASEALNGFYDAAKANVLVDLQGAALSLLGRLMRSESSFPWRAETVKALVVQLEDRQGRHERTPMIAWLGLRSMEADQSLNEYRTTRDVVLLMHHLLESACDASWEGKSEALPPLLSTDIVTRIMDFSVQVLLSLEKWTFTRNVDRWLLTLTVLELLVTFVSISFTDYSEDPTQECVYGLEVYRQSLLKGFREDGALMRLLLRCAEYLPVSVLHSTFEARIREQSPHDVLKKQYVQNAHKLEHGDSQGLYLARDGILPLEFEQKSLSSVACRIETAVLERLGIAALQSLSHVIKEYLALLPRVSFSSTVSPGNLELLYQTADVLPVINPGPWFHSQHRRKRLPLASHVSLIASLLTYGASGRGPLTERLSLVAIDVLGSVIRYVQHVRLSREEERVVAFPNWPRHLLHPSSIRASRDIMSVTDAQGFREALFATLTRNSTPGSSLISLLDLLVDITRLQPSLAKHVVFFRPQIPEKESMNRIDGDDGLSKGIHRTVEEVVLHVLRRAQSMAKADEKRPECLPDKSKKLRAREIRERETGMLALASALRFLRVLLNNATASRQLELLAYLDPAIWGILEWAVQKVVLDEALQVKVSEVTMQCYRLSVHRFVLDILSILIVMNLSIMSQNQQIESNGRRNRALCHLGTAIPRLMAALFAAPDTKVLLDRYLTASFRLSFVEDLSRRASGTNGKVPLDRFLLPDREEMLTDSSPRRFGFENFVLDLPALVRHMQASQLGMQMSEAQRMEVRRAASFLNQYYSISAAQHMVNKSFKGLITVVMGRAQHSIQVKNMLSSDVNIDTVVRTALSLILGDGEEVEYAKRENRSALGTEETVTGSEYFKSTLRKSYGDAVRFALKINLPFRELLLTLVDFYGADLPKNAICDTICEIRRSFERLKIFETHLLSGHLQYKNGTDGILMDLRQSYVTTTLKLLLHHPFNSIDFASCRWAELEGILAYTLESLTSHEVSLTDGPALSAEFIRISERREAVLRTSMMLLSALLANNSLLHSLALPKGGSRGANISSGEQVNLAHIGERTILRELRQHRVLSTMLGLWSSASKVAATAFSAIHDYTTVSGHAARSTAALEALTDNAVRLALERLSTILRFLEAAACGSKDFSAELLREGWIPLLMEDPLVACLVRAVKDGSELAEMKQLMYRRGYRADGEESPYYTLWRSAVRLMARLLHTLTRSHLGHEAVLALPAAMRDPTLVYAHSMRPEEADFPCEVAGFWSRFSPLLLWPLSEDKVLTLASLKEAQSVLNFALEIAIHGHTWRVGEPSQAEELRTLIKGMTMRISVVLGQAMMSSIGISVLTVLGEAFAPVSPVEIRHYRIWEEQQRAACRGDAYANKDSHEGRGKPPQRRAKSRNLDSEVEWMLMDILASALAFLRHTNLSFLPRKIPLTPEEATQVVLAEGTRVWYRGNDSELYEGVIQRRIREFHPNEAFLMGTYDILRRLDHVVEKEVRAERITMIEDRAQERVQVCDIDFDLPDPSTGIPSFNRGRLSSAHLLVVARFTLLRLRGVSRDKREEALCINILIHVIHLLLTASRMFFRSRGAGIQNKERTLPRFMAVLSDVLWEVSELRVAHSCEAVDSSDALTGDSKRLLNSDLNVSYHSHQHQLHDMFVGVGEADNAEERIGGVKKVIDLLVQKMHTSQELGRKELKRVLVECYDNGQNLQSGIAAWLIFEARQHGYRVGLEEYAAALRACSQDVKMGRVGQLLDDMIENVGLSTLLNELKDKVQQDVPEEGTSLSYVVLSE